MVYGYMKSIYDAIKKQKISARRTRAKVFCAWDGRDSGRRAVPRDTWKKGCRIIDREKCFTYFPVVYRRTMSPATRARGQKRRTNGPHYFARVGTTHGRPCEPKLPPSLTSFIFYTNSSISFSICFFAAKILDISQGGDIKSAIARSQCGLDVRLTTVRNGRILARLCWFWLITSEKMERFEWTRQSYSRHLPVVFPFPVRIVRDPST